MMAGTARLFGAGLSVLALLVAGGTPGPGDATTRVECHTRGRERPPSASLRKEPSRMLLVAGPVPASRGGRAAAPPPDARRRVVARAALSRARNARGDDVGSRSHRVVRTIERSSGDDGVVVLLRPERVAFGLETPPLQAIHRIHAPTWLPPPPPPPPPPCCSCAFACSS